jgi:hypothetical protein
MSHPLHNDLNFTEHSTHFDDTAVQEPTLTFNFQGRQIAILDSRLRNVEQEYKLLEQQIAQQMQELQLINQNLLQLQGTPPTLEQHVWSMIVHAVRHPLTLIFLSCVLIYRLRTSTMV